MSSQERKERDQIIENLSPKIKEIITNFYDWRRMSLRTLKSTLKMIKI